MAELSNIQKTGLGELKRELEVIKNEFPNPEKFQGSLEKIEANGNLEKLRSFLKDYLGLPILADNICLLQRFIEHRITEMRKNQPVTT
ncbi:MAG TPA: hypothetical protein PLT32_02700 [bacterium]|nr:hypothetical protein [bacterium]